MPSWRPRRPAAILLVLSLLGVSLPACAPPAMRLSFNVDPDANNNSPVSISVIVAYEQPVIEKLLALSAKQWFQQREQFLRDHPKDVEEALWEFVPGQQIPPFAKKLKATPKLGVIFANYRSPGTHRYLFEPGRPTQLMLGQKGLNLPSQLEKSGSPVDAKELKGLLQPP
jgi:type VI secretion system protein